MEEPTSIIGIDTNVTINPIEEPEVVNAAPEAKNIPFSMSDKTAVSVAVCALAKKTDMAIKLRRKRDPLKKDIFMSRLTATIPLEIFRKFKPDVTVSDIRNASIKQDIRLMFMDIFKETEEKKSKFDSELKSYKRIMRLVFPNQWKEYIDEKVQHEVAEAKTEAEKTESSKVEEESEGEDVEDEDEEEGEEEEDITMSVQQKELIAKLDRLFDDCLTQMFDEADELTYAMLYDFEVTQKMKFDTLLGMFAEWQRISQEIRKSSGFKDFAPMGESGEGTKAVLRSDQEDISDFTDEGRLYKCIVRIAQKMYQQSEPVKPKSQSEIEKWMDIYELQESKQNTVHEIFNIFSRLGYLDFHRNISYLRERLITIEQSKELVNDTREFKSELQKQLQRHANGTEIVSNFRHILYKYFVSVLGVQDLLNILKPITSDIFIRENVYAAAVISTIISSNDDGKMEQFKTFENLFKFPDWESFKTVVDATMGVDKDDVYN
jgi:hypothetical protein